MVFLTYELIKQKSEQFSVPFIETALIGLNLKGVDYLLEDKNLTRGRFVMKPFGVEDKFFFALSIDTSSPYKYTEEGLVMLDDHLIGKAEALEEDTCDDTYFRMNKKAMTLNSNSRSSCQGCKFCGTYILDPNEDNDLTNETNLARKIESILKTNDMVDMGELDNIGIVTGCFATEEEALQHVLMVRKVFGEYGFKGELKYIGSQIRTEESLDKLVQTRPFGLYLTVECFERRSEMMKPVKASLTLDTGRDLLEKAKEKGMETSMLYILGLDSLERVKQEFEKYTDVLTRHPVINLMQNYVPKHEALRDPEAKELDYYLKARVMIERIFESTGFKPRLWENYRSPWLTNYRGERIAGEKI